MSGSLGVNVVVVEVIERKVDVVVGSVKVLVASAICPSPPDDAEVLTDVPIVLSEGCAGVRSTESAAL